MTVLIKSEDLFEALEHLTRPATERLRLAREAVGKPVAPPFLDDYVLHALRTYGLIELIPTTREKLKTKGPGTPIATGPNGLSIVQLTQKGRDAIAAGAIDIPNEDIVEPVDIISRLN